MNSTANATPSGESTTSEVSNRWPPQIKYIVGNEACERFSYYGMRSILASYITGAVLEHAAQKSGLGKTRNEATEIIHLFVAANYFMPLIGAWISDKFIGRYHTILWVSLFYCAGHGTLACSDFVGTAEGKFTLLCVGLALIAFGSGGIKPCVSAFMGDQFKPEQGHLLQKAYGAFYWSINLGSFFSFLIIPWLKDNIGYSVAFGVPGILMAIATFVFWLGTKHYVRVPPSRETKTAGFFRVFMDSWAAGDGFQFWPFMNVVTTIVLPVIAMIMMVCVSFAPADKDMSFVRTLGWIALAFVIAWYAGVILLSLLKENGIAGKFSSEILQDSRPKGLGGCALVKPHSIHFCFCARVLDAVRPNQFHLGFAG